MTGRASRIRKYILFFSKNLYFLKNGDFVKNILGKSSFFSCDFDIFDGSIGCATKFHADEISLFLSISVRSKVITFFCQKFAKVEHTICDCN